MLSPGYPIQTDRLLLRPLDPATDVDAVHDYASRPEVCRYIPRGPRSREQVVEWMTRDAARSTLDGEGQALNLAVLLRDGGTLVGDVLLFYRSAEHRLGEIGYVFNPDHGGCGYATEAGRALLSLGFDGLGLHRVIARIDARNDPSAAVLRRLGMRQEAVLVENEWFKGEWATEIDFAILESEWRALGEGLREG
ncbi:GNAT family N-acetyltransferase [uncultured Jatrophihabitans sp.]|uniref:GNAT family N-acetyltransferase n=1 Tax=uncultured Jatrophihabitans sp. TaxID=1610747 RepID=UPI0035CC33B5